MDIMDPASTDLAVLSNSSESLKSQQVYTLGLRQEELDGKAKACPLTPRQGP